MHCIQCGTLAASDAKFCFKCGHIIGREISSEVSGSSTAPAKVKPSQSLWLYLFGLLTVGTYAAMFIPAVSGHAINPQATSASMIWTGLFLYLFWKKQARKGWHGALLGIALGLSVSVVATIVSGLMRNTGS